MNVLTKHYFDSPAEVFTASDVAISIPGTKYARDGLIKRAIANGEIIHIRRGLYCLSNEYQKKPLNTFSLSHRMYGSSYISLESALSYHGWIPEAVYGCTSCCNMVSKEFKTPIGIYSYKRIPQQILFAQVERIVDEHGNVFLMALPQKALADYVYAHRRNWGTLQEAQENLRIEDEDIEDITVEELRNLSDNYRSSRVQRFISGWMKELS